MTQAPSSSPLDLWNPEEALGSARPTSASRKAPFAPKSRSKALDPTSTAEIVVDYDPISTEMLDAGLGAGGGFATIRKWTRTPPEQQDKSATNPTETQLGRWVYLRDIGTSLNFKVGQSYHLQITVRGTLLSVFVDEVELMSGNLQFPLGGRQVGLFCQSRGDIQIRNFEVKTHRPMAFVVMQLHPPEYEDLFNKVIVPVCDKMGLEAFRASQTYEPGLIISDIQRQIRQSRVVIDMASVILERFDIVSHVSLQ